jgi:hypothetical protein
MRYQRIKTVAIVYTVALSFSAMLWLDKSAVDQSNDMTTGAELLP